MNTAWEQESAGSGDGALAGWAPPLDLALEELLESLGYPGVLKPLPGAVVDQGVVPPQPLLQAPLEQPDKPVHFSSDGAAEGVKCESGQQQQQQQHQQQQQKPRKAAHSRDGSTRSTPVGSAAATAAAPAAMAAAAAEASASTALTAPGTAAASGALEGPLVVSGKGGSDRRTLAQLEQVLSARLKQLASLTEENRRLRVRERVLERLLGYAGTVGQVLGLPLPTGGDMAFMQLGMTPQQWLSSAATHFVDSPPTTTSSDDGASDGGGTGSARGAGASSSAGLAPAPQMPTVLHQCSDAQLVSYLEAADLLGIRQLLAQQMAALALALHKVQQPLPRGVAPQTQVQMTEAAQRQLLAEVTGMRRVVNALILHRPESWHQLMTINALTGEPSTVDLGFWRGIVERAHLSDEQLELLATNLRVLRSQMAKLQSWHAAILAASSSDAGGGGAGGGAGGSLDTHSTLQALQACLRAQQALSMVHAMFAHSIATPVQFATVAVEGWPYSLPSANMVEVYEAMLAERRASRLEVLQ